MKNDIHDPIGYYCEITEETVEKNRIQSTLRLDIEIRKNR
jgi:hypothetical protein